MTRTRVIRAWITGILFSVVLGGAGGYLVRAQTAAATAATAENLTKSLLDKAQAAEARGRMDLAVQAWQQVLLGDPKNAAALAGMVRASRSEGDTKLADSYAQRLKAVGGTDTASVKAAQDTAPPRAEALIAKTALTSDQAAKVAQAEKLLDQGQYAEALKRYRAAFGSQPPADWAVPYYEAQAATGAERPQALAGLRALVATYPQQERFQVALGRVLTYDPGTRLEGRGYLAKYPQNEQAAKALRQSLLWDAANPAAAPEIRAYLATHNDAQLAAVFQSTQPVVPAPVVTMASAPPTVPQGSASPAASTGVAQATGGVPISVHTGPEQVAVAQGGGSKPEVVSGTPSSVPATVIPQASVAAAGAGPEVMMGTPSTTPATVVVAQPPVVKGPQVIDVPPTMASSPVEQHTVVHTDARTLATAEVAAYQSLNANRIDEAEARFKAILVTSPDDGKALAGMGYVRMQQGNFPGAISFLEQARAKSGSEDKGLTAALDTARFWFVMGEGHNAFAGDDLTTAEKRYREALALRPNNAEAMEGLGSTLLKAQQPGPAIPIFAHAVEIQPASAEGWRGLFMAEFRNDEAAIALTTYNKIPDAPRAQLMNDALFLQSLASAYSSVGRAADAQAALETALKKPFAANEKGLKTDIQIELAGNLSSANHLDQALAIYAQVIAADPANAAAWQGQVRIEHSLNHDSEALATIEKMPPAIYADAVRAPGFAITVASVYEALKKLDRAQDILQKAVTEETNAGVKPSPALEMQLAALYAERGSPQLAYPVYQQVLRENSDRADAWAGLLSALHVTGHDKEAVAQLDLIPAAPRAQLQKDPAYLQTMAAVYAGVGRPNEASQARTEIAQESAAERGAPPAQGEIERAWALYNGIDDAGLYRQLMSLGDRGDLTADQRRTIQTIWTNWAARRAEQASAVGNSRRALEILNAAARAFPDNPAAIKLLAAGYTQAGEPHQAVLIYRTQNMAAATAADYEGAVAAALSDGDNKDAEIWVRFGLAAFPADPQVLILAARFEQSRGDTAKAIKYYAASLKVMPPTGPGKKNMPELGLPAPLAPLSLPSAGQPQDISLLLSPEYVEAPASSQPYLPSVKTGTLPPYNGMTQLVPPYMTNPGGKAEATADAASVSPEVKSAVHDASAREMGVVQAAQAEDRGASKPSHDTQTVVANGEVYRPFVPYVAPSLTGYRGTPTTTVNIQLGNDAPHPAQAQADVTDVLPTEHYGISARANQAAASSANVAAARAERIRRLQAEAAQARSGQSHPPSEETITGMIEPAEYTAHAQVPKVPASPPKVLGDIPDTGAQQFPQPATQPPPDVTVSPVRPAAPAPALAKPARPTPARTAPPVKATVASRRPAPVRIAPAAPVPVAPVVPTPAPVQQAAVLPQVITPVVPSPPRQVAEGDAPIGPAYPLASPPTDADLRAHNLPALGGAYNAQVPLPQTPRQQAENELASLEGTYSGWVGATGLARYRNGTSGLDRLYDFEAPVEASAVFGRSLRMTVVAEPVFLNSGPLNTAAYSTADVPYLGTLAANALNPPAQQYSNGIGGELQLATKNIGLAFGYTPYEFLVRNFTGRFVVNVLANHFSIYGDRQPVKDTQLSYAGLSDPGTTTSFAAGPVWGGVIASTGGARVQLGTAGANVFLSGEGGILTGQHVLDNYRFKGEAGASFRVMTWKYNGAITLGGVVSAMHYQRNEVGLSYGQGGYFSPDYYYSAAVPVKLEGRVGENFHYSIAGSAGVQRFEQDAALFFPLDPGLQTSFVAAQGAACTPALAATYACGEYPQLVSTQVSYAVNSEVSYRFADHWYGGGFVLADNARDFETVSAGFFLRYVFRGQRSPQGVPAGLFQIDGVRALQIP